MHNQVNDFFSQCSARGIGKSSAHKHNFTMELRIDELLREKGDSQVEMAERLNVKPSTVSKWVRNVSSPPMKKLPAIAAYFGVEFIDLFRGLDLTPSQKSLLRKLPQLSKREEELVRNMIDTFTDRDQR